MASSSSSNPPLLVPSLLWGGGGDDLGGSLYKVPLHTFGHAKKRYLRLKQYNNSSNSDSTSSSWVEVALVDVDTDTTTKKYCVVKAAYPLALVWDDPKSSPLENPDNTSNSLISSPFKKKATDVNEIQLNDTVQVVGGNRTDPFQAFIAKNGDWSIQHESCCFSLISAKRSVDFYVLSAAGNGDGRDAKMATVWRESLQILLDNFHRKQSNSQYRGGGGSMASSSSMVRTPQRWNPKLHSEALFEAVRGGDIGSLRYFLDHGCPVDYQDDLSGDTILIVACRLGLLDVARLALLGYNARNDPHPDFGKTALQTAVSAGHTGIVKLILETAETSGADKVISNHEDENGEAPIHVASRCGSIDIMELLVMHGANLGLIDGRGRTCLHCAAQAGQAECLLFALDCGADEYIEAFSNDGFTPLHLAVRTNKTDCVLVLLQAGADVSTETMSGANVYNLASKQRCERLMKLLLEYDVSSASEGEDSYYDTSYDSISSEEDMFRGLNTYHVGSTQQMGGLLSPVNRPQTNLKYRMPSNNIGNHHSQWTQMNSPIAGVNHRFGNGDRQFNDSITRHLESNDDGDFYFGGDLWKIYVTEDGHTYFYNVNKDSSSWQDPRSSMKHVSFSEQRCAQTPASPGQGGNHDRPVILSPASCKRKLTAIPHPSNTQTKDGITRGSLSPGVPSVASPVPGRHKSQLNETVSGSSAIAPANHQSSAARNIHVNLVHTDQAAIPHPLVKSHNNQKAVPSNSHSCAAKQDAPDPKSMLLAQINSRSAIVGSSIQSTRQPAMCDLESLRLAQRKSRSGGDVGVTQSSVSPPTTQEKGDHASAKDDPKSLLLAQIKSRSSSAEGVTHSLLWSATEEDTTAKAENKSPKSSPSNDPEMAKYVKMKAVGIPLPAIKQKMKLDGINPGKIKRFESFDSSSDATPNQKENVAPHDNVIKSPKQQSKDQVKAALIQDESTKKFMRMASVGVPAKAVSHKMQQEGVDISKIAMFNEYHGLVTACTKPPASSKSQSTTFTKEDLSKDSTFDKYIKMTKVGVPCMAIAVKMKNDGVDKEKIIMFSEAFGLKPANRGSQATSKPFPKPWRGSRRASKALQKIHWTSVSEDKLQNSLWASGDVSEKDDIKDSEIEEIESLFSLSPIRRAAAGNKKIATNKSSKATSVIDPKRANNTAIALAQFRAYKSFDDLCQAVASRDSTHLDLEKLHNMVLLLPRSDEIASLKQYKDQSDGLSLGRAELWFLAVMKVPCFQQKLHTFKYTLQFDELTQSLTKSLNLLKKACREVTESKKLAGLLRRLLAIGNLMNESCQKPPTMGITLDSLIKTAKKKGSDGKTTVLDLLVSTSIENKLDIVHFWSDMPSVGESTKCDLEDYRSLLREIETGAQSVECFIEAEKSQEHSCTDAATKKSLSQLVPFMKRAHGEIDSLKKLFSIVERRVQSLCSFFAEDAKTCKTSSIFAVLIEFSRLVDQAKQKAHRKQNAMNRRSSMTMNRPTSAPGL